MNKRSTFAATLALPFLLPAAYASDANKVSVAAIPYEVRTENLQLPLQQTGDKLSLTATKGTDLFNDLFSGENKNNAPRFLFKPNGDFIFSAKFSGAFAESYDGGALIVYADDSHYGKLTFEQGHDHKPALWSTVTNSVADDVHHRAINGNAIYVKVARAKNLYLFYISADGKQWDMLRSFTLTTTQPISVGILAQTPSAEKFTLQVSDIHYAGKTFTDFWQGE